MSAAAAWLYKATNETQYLTDAETFYPNGTAWGFNWNDDNVGAAVRNQFTNFYPYQFTLQFDSIH